MELTFRPPGLLVKTALMQGKVCCLGFITRLLLALAVFIFKQTDGEPTLVKTTRSRTPSYNSKSLRKRAFNSNIGTEIGKTVIFSKGSFRKISSLGSRTKKRGIPTAGVGGTPLRRTLSYLDHFSILN